MLSGLSEVPLVEVLGLQTILLIIAGSPFAWWLALQAEGDTPVSVGALLSAPLYGVLTVTWIAGMAFRAGTSSTIPVVVVPLLILFVVGRTRSSMRSRALLRPAGIALVLLSIVFLAVLFTNTSDLASIGVGHYFPRTNGDTFSYLGLLDQIKAKGLSVEPMTYPAGYSPYFATLRTGVASFLATESTLIGLSGNAMFFATLRLMLILAATGIIVLLLLLGVRNVVAVAAAVVVFVAGNFMLHQVLQQFLSSSTGVVAGIAALATGIIAVRRRSTVLVAGAACGVYSTISAEAFPVITTGILAAILFPIITSREPFSSRLTRSCGAAGVFAGGFVLGCLPFAPRVWSDTWLQWMAATGKHPGDWIAQFGYILQASGVVPFYKGEGFSAAALAQQGFSIAVLSVVTVGVVFFAGRCLLKRDGNVSRLAVLVPGAMALSASLLLFGLGRGYTMLKMWDYHMFIPAIVIGLWIDRVVAVTKSSRSRAILSVANICLIAGFAMTAWSAKVSALTEFGSRVSAGPALDEYVYEADDRVKSIRPDLHGVSRDLFLYMNRFRPTPVVSDGSNRFRFTQRSDFATHVFRMEHPSTGDADYLEINRPGTPEPRATSVIPATNYLEILPEPSWLNANGHDRSSAYRWLGTRGDFRIWDFEPGHVLRLHVSIGIGPDFPDGGTVEVMLDEKTLVSLNARDLPFEQYLSFSAPETTPINGAIIIKGGKGNLREVSVARLFVDSTISRDVGAGWFGQERDATGEWRWLEKTGELNVDVPANGTVTMRAEVAVIGAPTRRVTLSVAGQPQLSVTQELQERWFAPFVSQGLHLRAGRQRLTLTADGPVKAMSATDGRQVRIGVKNVTWSFTPD